MTALAVAWLAADSGWSWRLGFDGIGAGPDWNGWPLLSVIVLVAAWLNVLAWAMRLWPLAAICGLLTVAAPWGFIYPGIVLGPILAVAAALAWARTKASRADGG